MTTFERIMSDRMRRLEDNLQNVAAAQQAQIDRLITTLSPVKAAQEAKKDNPKPVPAAETSPGSQDSQSVEEGDKWAEFFGATLWKKEQDKARKNPFDQCDDTVRKEIALPALNS